MIKIIQNPAVLVIDMQNDFCSDKGMFRRAGMDVSQIQAMAVNLIEFLKHIHRLGIPTAYIISHYDLKYLPKTIFEVYKRKGLAGLCTSGTSGADIFILEPQQSLSCCNVFVKHRYDAFTNMEFVRWLEKNKIKSLILTGCQTDVCVDSTARSGFMRGYYIVAIEDCLASSNCSNHNYTLKFMSNYYGAQIRSSKLPLKRVNSMISHDRINGISKRRI